MQESIKIQKYLADCGLLSRRAAERAVCEGKVTVNGELAALGQRIFPQKDKVTYLGKVVEKRRDFHPTYLMLNKPVGYVTTMSDDKGRKTVADLVADVGVRVYPVGRLDMDSEGLLLFTNDGELANALTHPKHQVPKFYDVTVEGRLPRAALLRLSEPMEIDGLPIAPVECHLLKRGETASTLRMILYEGRNRQIRKMCEQVGLTVKRLRRVAVGSLTLDIGRGKWRYLDKEEADTLKAEAGLLPADRKTPGAKNGKTTGANPARHSDKKQGK